MAQAVESEHYLVLRTLEIHAFSSTQVWAEVELTEGNDEPKKGWVYWGDTRGDSPNFERHREQDDDIATPPSPR